MSKKDNIKQKFIKDFKKFSETLCDVVSCSDGQWTVKGFIDVFKNVYTISSDTKIVSKILEIQIYPIIREFADSIGYRVEGADKQNYYPDFTFIKKDDENVKFAVDIKSTYRRFRKTVPPKVEFTLGSHGEYFRDRNSTKNIQYPYSQYSGHFCLAIVYTQIEEIDDEDRSNPDKQTIFVIDELGNPLLEDKYQRNREQIESLQQINSVIKDMKFYFAEKWKIASDGQGSGNTANIGSTKTEKDIKDETGVFSMLGEDYFDDYWINYGNIEVVKDGQQSKIKNIWDYLAYRHETEKFSIVGHGAKNMPDEYKDKSLSKKSKKKK